MYAVMIIKPDWRAWAALAASAVYGAMGLLAPHEILTAIDWNILMMLFGTMITVGYFIRSRMPNGKYMWNFHAMIILPPQYGHKYLHVARICRYADPLIARQLIQAYEEYFGK